MMDNMEYLVISRLMFRHKELLTDLYSINGKLIGSYPTLFLQGFGIFDLSDSSKKVILPEKYCIDYDMFLSMMDNIYFDTLKIDEESILQFFTLISDLKMNDNLKKFYLSKYSSIVKKDETIINPFDELKNIIEIRGNHISILLNKKLIGTIPELFLLDFEYCKKLIFNDSFVGTKEMELFSDYTEEMALFFVSFVSGLYINDAETNIGILKAEPKYLIWVCKFVDDFIYNDTDSIQHYIEHLKVFCPIEYFNFEMYSHVINFTNDKIMSPTFQILENIILEKILANPIIKQIKPEFLMHEKIRNILGNSISKYRLIEENFDSDILFLVTVCYVLDAGKIKNTFVKKNSIYDFERNLFDCCFEPFQNTLRKKKYFNFAMFGELRVLYPKTLSPNAQKIFELIEKNLKENPIIEQIQYDSFRCIDKRNYVVDILKNYSNLPETSLLSAIVEQIMKLNKIDEGIKKEAIPHILRMIDWFNVNEKIGTKYFNVLTDHYGEIKIKNFDLIHKRPQFIDGYTILINKNEKLKGEKDPNVTFNYSGLKELNLIKKERNQYHKKIMFYDSMQNKLDTSQTIQVYTTTSEPELITFDISCRYNTFIMSHTNKKNGLQRDKIKDGLFCRVIISYAHNNEEKIITRKWFFGTSLKMEIGEIKSHINITINELYFAKKEFKPNNKTTIRSFHRGYYERLWY